MKKRMYALLLAACLLLTLLPMGGFASETEATEAAVDPNAKSGTCGEGLTWVLEEYTLTVSGSGEMDDGAPWQAHKDHIEHVVFTGGVTKIGAEAFYKYDRIETVDFGDALVEIGEKAFYGCEDIDYIHLPKTFRKFGAEAFRECLSLKRVYCDGGMPRFNDSCLWTGNYISVFFPTNNPWPAEYTQPLASSYGGNLGIMMGNFDQSVVNAELGLTQTAAEEEEKETEARKEPEPEETGEKPEPVNEPSAAPTEAAVVVIAAEREPQPPVETEPAETTVPETEAPTIPTAAQTEPPETTEETQPAPTVEDLAGSSWIGMVMIAGVLTFLVAGAVIFRILSRKGGRYRR